MFYLFVYLICAGQLAGILVPCPEIKPKPMAVKASSPNHWPIEGVPPNSFRFFAVLVQHVKS